MRQSDIGWGALALGLGITMAAVRPAVAQTEQPKPTSTESTQTAPPATPAEPAKTEEPKVAETPPPAAAPVAAAPAPAPAPEKKAKALGDFDLGEGWKLNIDGQYRPRLNATTGYKFTSKGTPDATVAYFTHRARLGTTVNHKDGWGFRFQLQDVRIWGEEQDRDRTFPLAKTAGAGTATANDFNADGLDVHEAYGVLPIGDMLKLKIGRQEMAFDNHRIVGTLGWYQRARSFDQIRATYKAGAFDADIWWAKIAEADGSPDGHNTLPPFATTKTSTTGVTSVDKPGKDLDFIGVHATYDLGKILKASVLYAFHGDYTIDENRHTAGVFLTGGFEDFAYSADAYFQFGKRLKDATKTPNEYDSISAWLFGVKAGYTLSSVPMKPSITAYGDFLSGGGKDGPKGSFNTLYATNHAFYGDLDFFLAFPLHTGNLGLMDIGGQLAIVPMEKTKLSVDFHHFGKMASVDGLKGSSFGNELDVKFVGTILPRVNIEVLYGMFMLGDLTVGGAAGKDVPDTFEKQIEHAFFLTTDLSF